MFDQLQSRLPLFRTRLSETVAWCMPQPLESDPVEGAEIQERRRLGKDATKLVQRAFKSDQLGFWKSVLYRRATALYEKARLHEINPLAHQLRSSVLHPSCARFPSNRPEQVQVVEDLAHERANQLRFKHHYLPILLNDLAGGRLLLYSPDENLCDGAAQYTSKGFFDVDNIPPWDTWVCFFEQYLVSWVPPKLVELANQGIDVNPERCILWAPDTALNYRNPDSL
jgi:hypothetical protein